MFENQYRSYVLENSYFRGLAEQGIELSNYFGVMHPSQTNYIASIAGELCNVTDDDAPPPLPQKTIVDLIEASPLNLSWKAYMDSYIPQNQPWSETLQPKDEFPYVIKHNPFSSFANIQENSARWKKIVNESQFWADLLNDDFPEYAWFTPNMWNDGHYLNGTQTDPHERAPALVDQAAIWLQGFFKQLKFPGENSHLPANTLVVITFDEADFEADWDIGKKYTYDGPNQVYTVLLGDSIKPAIQAQGYNHYSLLKTIEKNFQLDSLQKNDSGANWFQFLWGKEFKWCAPVNTSVNIVSNLTAASHNDSLYVVYQNENDELLMQCHANGHWSDAYPTGFIGSGEIALATACATDSTESTLLLAFENEHGSLSFARYTDTLGWTCEAEIIYEQAVSAIAMCTFDTGTILVWRDRENNQLLSCVYSQGEWQTTTNIGPFAQKLNEASIALSSIGPSIFLFIEDKECGQTYVASYNTAAYNVVSVAKSDYAGPWDNTTYYCWSKDLFPVARFCAGPNDKTPDEDEPVTQIYKTGSPLATAELNGVIHLVHPGSNNSVLLSETFSVAGIMTAELPVSYNAKEDKTTSNGYGTLAEAGWSEQYTLESCRLAPEGILSVTRVAEELILLYQNNEGKLAFCSGGYVKNSCE